MCQSWIPLRIKLGYRRETKQIFFSLAWRIEVYLLRLVEYYWLVRGIWYIQILLLFDGEIWKIYFLEILPHLSVFRFLELMKHIDKEPLEISVICSDWLAKIYNNLNRSQSHSTHFILLHLHFQNMSKT